MTNSEKSIDALLLAMSGHWRLLSLCGERIIDEPTIADRASATELAAWVKSAAIQHQVCIRRLVLALPSRACFAVSMPLESFGGKADPTTLRYALEEFVPHVAEELAADFVQSDSEVFAVAALKEHVRAYSNELNALNISVEMIVPAALWMAQTAVDNDSTCLLLGHGDSVDLIVCGEGKPTQWRHLIDPSAQAVIRELKLLGAPQSVRWLGPTSPTTQNDLAAAGYSVEEKDFDWDAVATASADLLSLQTDPWIELSADVESGSLFTISKRLGRQVSLAAAAVIVLLASIIGFSLLRAGHDARELAGEQRRQQEIFSAIAPGKPLPPDIFSRLSAELRGARGLATAKDESLESVDALQGLYLLVESLPPNTRFQLTDVRIDTSRTLIEGLAREHSDAEVVAAAVGKVPGWTVEPPRTQNLSTGQISFVVNASPTAQTGGKRR